MKRLIKEKKMTKKARVKTRRLWHLVLIIGLLVVLTGGGYVWYVSNYSLVLKGDQTIRLGLCGTYKELGAAAVISGKDVGRQIKIKNNVDTTKPGTYSVVYACGKLKAKRTVIIGKEMNPKLRVAGEQKTTIKLGDAYRIPKVKATDEQGNDISRDVKVGKTSFKRAGKYQVSFSAEDGKGNSTTIYRDVEVTANTDYEAAGLAICMYHYVYDAEDPPEDLIRRYGNYIEVHAFEEELQYLSENKYYYPSWQEVRDYVDGKLILPEKSVVLSFDDGARNFLKLGIPALEKWKVPATCFMITSGGGAKKVSAYQSEYVSYQSHSDKMHQGGGVIGQGGIITALPEEDALEDLKKSIEICGNDDAFAYPYGDFSQGSRDTVEKAGFSCAVTTQYGKVYPGDDPYLLNRIRMNNGQSLETFITNLK